MDRRSFLKVMTGVGGAVFDQEQIARAVELGLGVSAAVKIEFVTPDAESGDFADRLREILLTT